MTDESRGHGGVLGPPWSVDVLADLHAGVLGEQESAELWPRVNADPEARAILDALESTTTDLSGYSDLDLGPMPADVADRIDAALELQRQGARPADSTVVSLDTARRKRAKRLGWGAGLLTAAAAAVAAVVVLPTLGDGGGSGSDLADEPGTTPPSAGAPPLALSSSDPAAAVGDISTVRDFGPLGGEQRLDACLAANGVDPAVRPVGFRPVTVDGREALVVLLTTGELGQLRMLALAPDCGPDNPGVLLDETVGRQG
ncbi:hypothetical protein B1813_14160 [Saccharomonospora piscinae]|uniref:Anti-sigma-M factor RsmA n=1 Tax=Saccharomonospora piscinae TaxID=687388 RepID=A0A1V9A0U7_SACPI|nr:hypothetical protein [Saccharomonospora piscinae]OQO90690.1 hypothetical protein B1813_14160 [Saccharomonospora piscinae]